MKIWKSDFEILIDLISLSTSSLNLGKVKSRDFLRLWTFYQIGNR